MINFNSIKLCIFDVDGCLTDGIYQISESKEVTKSFYTRDMYGIEEILKECINVIIITQSHDKVIESQIERIAGHSRFWRNNLNSRCLQILTAVDYKKETIEKEILISDHIQGWHNIAYFGDAENDINCMKKALFTGCPFDAINDVKYNANYISNFNGGKGAVYDFCMHIVEKRNND